VTAREFDEFLWAARPALLALKSELAAQRFLLAARRLAAVLRKAGFNPDQPRDDQGRWIDSGGADDQEQDSQVVLAGGPRGRSGYPIDLLEEEALGGHTVERHVAKPEEYLKARILGSRRNIAGIVTFGEARAGSFTSLGAANKLVNSTLARPSHRLADCHRDRRSGSARRSAKSVAVAYG
jgi:hypothetical protein